MTTKKYVIVSVTGGDQFEDGFFIDKNAAIETAIASYHALSNYDKKNLNDFFVGLFECEEINGRWFFSEESSDPIEVVLSFDDLKNGKGIEYGDNKIYNLDEAKKHLKREYIEDFDKGDIDNFNKEVNNVDSFVELIRCLESWKKTFEDKRTFEVLYI